MLLEMCNQEWTTLMQVMEGNGRATEEKEYLRVTEEKEYLRATEGDKGLIDSKKTAAHLEVRLA